MISRAKLTHSERWWYPHDEREQHPAGLLGEGSVLNDRTDFTIGALIHEEATHPSRYLFTPSAE